MCHAWLLIRNLKKLLSLFHLYVRALPLSLVFSLTVQEILPVLVFSLFSSCKYSMTTILVFTANDSISSCVFFCVSLYVPIADGDQCIPSIEYCTYKVSISCVCSNVTCVTVLSTTVQEFSSSPLS